ncbi:MAG: hypothetical protein KAR83_06750 [Thermodesulfovibrionales bacterium]|nr:hypothetical protein [Thermodesulfovibrionales bacterium]
MYELWYGISSIVLGVALFVPVRGIIYSMSYNRFVAKRKKHPTDDEAKALKKRSGIVAGIIAVTFAFVFAKVIMFKYFGAAGR